MRTTVNIFPLDYYNHELADKPNGVKRVFKGHGFVCYLLFVSRYMQLGGLGQRLCRCPLRATVGFLNISVS